MLSRNERIDRKTQLLEHLDPEREVELEGTFTNLVRLVESGSPPECVEGEFSEVHLRDLG